MTRYLLDTNVVSDLIRFPSGQVTARIRELGEAAVFTSVVVAAELRFGAAKRGSARLSAQVDAVLGVLEVAALERPVDATYGQVRAELEAAGTPIGANDLLIAAHARTLDAVLVTDNEREFARIPGLRLENWLRTADR